MKIGSIGFNHTHGADFVFDRPNGPGAVLFLLVKSSAKFTLGDNEFELRPNTAVLINYNTPCRYGALEDRYTDDWMFIDCEEGDSDRFERLAIPFDTPVYPGNIEELSQLMYLMTYEHYSAEKYHTKAEGHYLGLLFIKLSRQIQSRSHPDPNAFISRNAALTHIRYRIYTEPQTVAGVDSLAAEVNLSRSGFQHAYKKMYGVSVMADIVSARMELAMRLLSTTALNVEQIALRCGYSSAYSFMRQFKISCGITPTEYRRERKK